MRSEWETLTLAQAGIQLIDCDHRTPPAAHDGYPYVAIPQLKDGHIALNDVRRISAEHFAEWTKKLRPREHDVVVVRRCSSGTSAVVPKGLECAIGQNLVVLRADGRRVTPPFLRWLVRGEEWWEQVRKFLNVGAVFDSLKCRDIPNFEVLVPPLHEQHAICSTLNAIDERIGLLRQTNATLESIAQALFKSWFIDFDPVRAKAEGREPEGMDAATAALFPAEFEESALGLIPKGWSAGSLADLSALNSASWTARCAPEEVAYVDLAGVKANVFEPPQRLAFADAPSRARRELRSGDTLVGTVRPGNRSFGYIAETEPGLTGSTGFAVLSPVTAHAAAFVYLAATRHENIERLAALADGGAYPAVRPELVHATTCVLPLPGLLEAFHAVASPLLISIAANTQRARMLAEMRDTLLPRIISGKLRLPEAQAALLDARA